MNGLLGAAVRAVAGVEAAVDRLRYRGGAGAGRSRMSRVVPYDGYGTSQALSLFGRVLKGAPLAPARDGAGAWENLIATYRRFETDEVPGARVRVRAGGVEREVTADDEGYFRCRLVLDAPFRSEGWQDVEYTLVEPPTDGESTARGRALVPSAAAAFGVISDMDDTVVRTDVTQLLRMVRTVLFGNARTRLPFPGVAAFYRALAGGGAAGGPNPLFYVSSSPWNLHDLLAEFLDLQGIPRGPLMLRDWGVSSSELAPTRHGSHKQGAIRDILGTYPALPFILVGDSGQEDPEIYSSIVHDHPGRVLAIYIRDVTRNPTRTAAIARLAREVERVSCPLLLAEDTVGIARHAAERGWIDPAALSEIAGEAESDDPGGERPPARVVEE
ncbi:MAG TPA: phosphatase domain-containing protein [Gemmatimonadales bacterium]